MEDSNHQHHDASDRLEHLPSCLIVIGAFAFSDGGTIGLKCEYTDTIEFSIGLPPANCQLFPSRKPNLFVTEMDFELRESDCYVVAVRSALESQVISLLDDCKFANRMSIAERRAREFHGHPMRTLDENSEEHQIELTRIRDHILSFVRSDEYVNLNETNNPDAGEGG